MVKSVLGSKAYLDPTTMSGSTQPVAQTWRAAEPRYPPHGISYPVQIARPHTVRGMSAQYHFRYCSASSEARPLRPVLIWSQWGHWWQPGVVMEACNLRIVEVKAGGFRF